MARQKSNIQFEGSLGGLIFYKHPHDGYLAREKSGPNSSAVLNSERFQRTRENAQEFKQAIEGGRTIRNSLKQILRSVADGKLSSRMNRVMLELVQSDKVSQRGERKAALGDIKLLSGWEFNRDMRFENICSAAYSVSLNSPMEVIVNLPEIIVKKHLQIPDIAQYFRIVSGVAMPDFNSMTCVSDIRMEDLLACNESNTQQFEFRHSIKPGGKFLVALGVIFYAVPENIPKDAISMRKRYSMVKENGYAAYTGALKVVMAEG